MNFRTGRGSPIKEGRAELQTRQPLSARGSEDRFDEDKPGELFADGHARVADLADEIILAGDEADDLIFTQSDFAEAILDFRRGTKLFDAHRDTSLHAAQGTDFTARFRRRIRADVCRIHVHGNSFVAKAFGH